MFTKPKPKSLTKLTKTPFFKQPQSLKKTKSSQSDLVEVQRLNKITNAPEVLYYTPRNLHLNPEGRIFHPCDWSINDFQIGRHLGKGKYGHVYLARHRKTKAIVAIKVITKKQIVNHDIVFQLRRQLQIHSHLKHPNILAMHGFFFDQKRIYIILDYAPFGQLYKILQNQQKFSEQRAAHYIYQVIQALKYTHERKIIHRDIKPQNILLSIDDEIKLTDFGWSIHVADSTKRRRTYCGTPDYICPEIAFQRDYDFRLDLWCLGVLTYEFAAGFAPFSDCYDRKDLTRKIRQLEFEFPDHFSDEIQNFIRSLLRTKPEDRMSLQQAEKHPWIMKYYFEPMKARTQEKEKRKQRNEPEDVEI